jgi:oxidoreductase
VRTLVVGLGWVAGEVWLPRLLAHPGFEVAGVVDTDPSAAQRLVGLLGDTPVWADHRAVPLDGIDVVFVLTPNHTHGSIGEWFLARGRSVFLEKPTGTDIAQLEMLAAAAATSGARLVLSGAARKRADVGALRELVTSGVLGEPRLAEISWIRARGIPRTAWFTERASAGGGVLLDLGWHLIDLVHDLWSGPRPRGAAAIATSDFAGTEQWSAAWHGAGAPPAGRRVVDVEDRLAGFVTTDRFGLGVHVAWASHEVTDTTTVTLHGTDATARLVTTFGFSPCRVAEPALTVLRGGVAEAVALPTSSVGAEYDAQLDVLGAQLLDPSTTAQSLTVARWVLAVVDALYRSARSA